MQRQSRPVVLLYLVALVSAACGDSDPAGADGAGVLTGTWDLIESADVRLPLVVDGPSYDCQLEAEVAGYAAGFSRSEISRYWLTFSMSGGVTNGAAGRSRCVYVRADDVQHAPWGNTVQAEVELGVYRRSGADLEIFSSGADPDADPPELVGKVRGSRIYLRHTSSDSPFPAGAELVFERR